MWRKGCFLLFKAWLPDGCSRIFRSYVFGSLGFWTMAPLHYAAKFDPFFSLDCSPMPSILAQSKETKGSNFAIWQPCPSIPYSLSCFHLAAELSRTLMKVGRRCCSVESTRKREGRVGGSIYSFSSRQRVIRRPQRRRCAFTYLEAPARLRDSALCWMFLSLASTRFLEELKMPTDGALSTKCLPSPCH